MHDVPAAPSLTDTLFLLPPARLAEGIRLLPWRLSGARGVDASLLVQALGDTARRGEPPPSQLPGFHPPFRCAPGAWDVSSVVEAATSPCPARPLPWTRARAERALDGAASRLMRGRSVDPLCFLGPHAGVPGVGTRTRLAQGLSDVPGTARMAWWRASYWRRSAVACLLHRGLPPPSGAWGICLLPHEIAAILPGWPSGQSAVVCTDPSRRVRWGACHPGGERDVAAGAPLWPPADGEGTDFRPEAELEQALLQVMADEPGLAARAAIVEAPTMELDDLDW